MTVTGATTASLATVSYTPPFKQVTIYPPAVSVTGVIIDPNPTGNVSTGGGSGGSGGDSSSQYAWAYLNAHMMSTPSYRYAFLLWFCLALIMILYIVSHHLRLTRGSMGAGFSRWSMKRHTIGSKKPGRRNRALPANGLIVMATIIAVVSLVLGIIGPDYIAPSTSLFSFARSLRRRSSATSPQMTINKSLWTLGSRMGGIAFALTPLVVLFAIKSPPVAFLSLRPLTHLYADKLAFLHRATAWLVWAITTAHVVLWTVQLFEDSYQGIPTWVYLWTNYRFICGCVAYGALTGVMILSLRPIRKHRYELFYVSHIVLVILTIGGCAVHHPVLWYWMAAAGGLWAAERTFRYFRYTRINGSFGKKAPKPIVAGRKYSDVPAYDTQHGSREPKSVDFGYNNPYDGDAYVDKTLPKLPASKSQMSMGGSSNAGYYDESAFRPLGANDPSYSDPYAMRAGPSASTTTTLVGADQSRKPQYDSQASRNPFPDRPVPTPSPESGAVAPVIPKGYAQAQLLPSRTIRLTIKVPHVFKWAPGQSCLLYLPDLSKIQSHPFTIMNNQNDESEIVLMVKARKGLTRKLYEYIKSRSMDSMGNIGFQDRRMSYNSMAGEAGVKVPPVFIRTNVDGPFGSAARVHWNTYSSVTIICGGSGVSFGMAICDFICRAMARNYRNESTKFLTRRVRFCWVAREYAEIAWIARQLLQCQRMVSHAQLEVSIFVTKAGRPTDDFAPPQPGFVKGGHSRRNSQDSVMTEMSQDGPITFDDDTYEGTMESTTYSDVIDLTNYDDEEDVNDPAEQQLSDRLQHQGKVRRAKSRKVAKVNNRRGVKSPTNYTPSAYPPGRRGQSNYEDPDNEKQYGSPSGYPPALSPDAARVPYGQDPRAAFGGSPYQNRPMYSPDLDAAPQAPYARPPHSRSESFKSLADSSYARYDPYAGAGYNRGTMSPAPSIFLDDAHSYMGDSVKDAYPQTPRTGSMVLLEDAAGAAAGDAPGDAGLWIDQADYSAMNVLSEMARPGKPKLGSVLEEEIQRAEGRIMVATCGPVTLNTVVRNLVATHISPARMRHGDKRGHVAIYSEDYES